jgi:ribosome-binding protein aMBF1 (putative translation factor)
MSTKASLHSSARNPPRAASGAPRKPIRSGNTAKIDSSFKGRVGRKAENLRQELLSRILTVAAKHVERIDDAELPGVLKQLQAKRTLAEALRITLTHPVRPPATEGAIPVENQQALERAEARTAVNKVELLKRPDMLTGAQLAERLGLTRADSGHDR